MTEESLLLVKELKEKIHLVFGEFVQLEKRNEELQQVIVSLNNTVEVLEKEKGELTTRYENLKLARVLENGYGDNRLARQKINKMLREIDKCVALLNE
jgi:phage shock protein A